MRQHYMRLARRRRSTEFRLPHKTKGLRLVALFFLAAKAGGQQQRTTMPFNMSVNGGKGQVNGTLVCFETRGYWSASGTVTDTSPSNDRASTRYHFSSTDFIARSHPLPQAPQERKVEISLIFHGPLKTQISLSLEKVRAITGYDFTGLAPEFDRQAMRDCTNTWSSPH